MCLPKSKPDGILYHALQKKVNCRVQVLSKVHRKKTSTKSVKGLTSPERLTDRKRAAIVGAAAAEFQSRGYFSTSMNAIAAAADVSKRTLYNHFDSKEALFDAIIERLIQSAEELPVCTFDPDRDLREQLIELATVEVKFMASSSVRALARAGLSRVLAEPKVGKQIDHRRFHKRVESWLEDARKAGSLNHTDTQFATKQFVGLLTSFAFWPTIVNGESPPTRKKRQRIVESTVDMFLGFYATH